ncbi:MAG TPA: FG-GAP-like repeat-containing protein, partial [Pyrinomonadaceae bacterium]|nr:FG-GAP-like repeat-containing protein [Pyrinomonadaceae bacterium]
MDTSFNPFALRANGSDPINLKIVKTVRQPDGKILAVGNFSVVDGFSRTGVVRFNADGSVDPTFNPPEIYNYEYVPSNSKNPATISSIAVQSDGKVIIVGDFTKLNGVLRPKIARLNADGSPDTVFNSTLSNTISDFPYDVGIQPSGKILIGGSLCYTANFTRCALIRLNSDGSLDSDFIASGNYGKLSVTENGSFYYVNGGVLRKYDANGNVDGSFTPATINFFNSGGIFDILADTDGSVYVVGDFTSVNGFGIRYLVKFQSNGAIDTNFNSSGSGPNRALSAILKQDDGKLILGGSFTSYNGVAKPQLVRISATGEIDNTFNYPGNDGTVKIIVPLTNNKILIGGENSVWDRLERLESNGTKDTSYTTRPAGRPLINAVAKQADGKILVGGRFTVGNGQVRNNLARFNADGSIDTSFNPFSTDSTLFVVNDLKVLSDGKILVASDRGYGVVRLNSDGSKDTTFSTSNTFNGIYNGLAVLPDNSIIAVGVSGLRKLTSSGALVSGFNQSHQFLGVSGFSGAAFKTAIQADGKIIVVGEFTTVSSVARSRIVRFNTDGSIDSTFNSVLGANNQINDVEIQPDGKIVVVGYFTGLGGSLTVKGVGRFNSDATIDTSFTQTVNENVVSVELQTDGKILIGGAFTQVGTDLRSGLARLNANGAVDTSFQVGKGTNGAVNDLVVQDDGKIVTVGEFTLFNNVSKVGIARVLNNSTQQLGTRFDFDGDGRADLGVVRPSSYIWYQLLGANYNFNWTAYGTANDVLTPADYDGDGKTDISIFRPSTGQWVYGTQQFVTTWGQSGDIPLPSDVDGDGKADFVVFRPSDRTWYRFTNGNGVFTSVAFGAVGDQPVIGDFDGDGKSDPAVFRPSTG